MNISKFIEDAYKHALRNKLEHEKLVFSGLKAEIKNMEISLRPKEISEADIIKVVKNIKKKCQESLSYANQTGRTTCIEEYKEEYNILDRIPLPEQLSEGNIRTIINVLITEDFQSFNNLGAIMKYFKDNYSGEYDGGIVSKAAKEALLNNK